ncbi:MAG: electron transfer flavoprotein subunit alpha/FixB family protein [Bdellovibrionales bacterium]|nr:electron transfer flavoprotein subunit alpha/FixB family protein [Bdellovibrionales bacterium]
MKKILVLVESKNGKLKKSSQEVLSVALNSNYETYTCAAGEGSGGLGTELGVWGVQKHYYCTDTSVAQYNPESYQQFFAQIFETLKPDVVLGTSNMLARDVMPRLAAQFDCAYMSDITELSIGDDIICKRPMYAGKCMAQVSFTDESSKILLVRANQIPVVDASKAESTEAVAVTLNGTAGKTELVSIEKGESEKLDLTEADVIVSGGRGMKDADQFKLLYDLAEPLHATVGASRAVVDLGWVPHSLQVGQTGKTVTPTLYIAVGISGAIQHLAGMSGSKFIVAINKDEKAPIFQKASYGLVGDLFEILPVLAEKVKALKA